MINVNEINSLCNQIDGAKFAPHDALEKRVRALSQKVGKGLKVGKLLLVLVADGYALYFVVKVTTTKVYVRHVATHDAYAFQGVARDRTGLYVPRSVAQGSVGWDDMMTEHRDESKAFFQNLPTDSIVHYHNSFSQYVRCQVTPDKQLLPIALVGDWREFDLPRRDVNGEIYLGYHAQSIVNGEKFQPHAGNVWEYPQFDKKRYKDPTNLPPIDLTVPPMTPEQSALASKHQFVEKIEEIIRDNRGNPDKIISLIQELLS